MPTEKNLNLSKQKWGAYEFGNATAKETIGGEDLGKFTIKGPDAPPLPMPVTLFELKEDGTAFVVLGNEFEGVPGGEKVWKNTVSAGGTYNETTEDGKTSARLLNPVITAFKLNGNVIPKTVVEPVE